jgi:hypothetical protein
MPSLRISSGSASSDESVLHDLLGIANANATSPHPSPTIASITSPTTEAAPSHQTMGLTQAPSVTQATIDTSIEQPQPMQEEESMDIDSVEAHVSNKDSTKDNNNDGYETDEVQLEEQRARKKAVSQNSKNTRRKSNEKSDAENFPDITTSPSKPARSETPPSTPPSTAPSKTATPSTSTSSKRKQLRTQLTPATVTPDHKAAVPTLTTLDCLHHLVEWNQLQVGDELIFMGESGTIPYAF